jgi:hypothetical protein
MHDPYYDTDPYEAVFSKMDVMNNIARGQNGNTDPFRIIAAMQQPHRKGTPCPRCHRIGTSCKISYCVYG